MFSAALFKTACAITTYSFAVLAVVAGHAECGAPQEPSGVLASPGTPGNICSMMWADPRRRRLEEAKRERDSERALRNRYDTADGCRSLDSIHMVASDAFRMCILSQLEHELCTLVYVVLELNV